MLLLFQIKVAADKRGCEVTVVGLCQVPLWGGRCVLCVCVYLMMTAPLPPTIISHHRVLKRPGRTDSVGLMEVDMEIVGVDGMSLIVICTQILSDNQETASGDLKCVLRPANAPKPAHTTLSHEEFVTSKLWFKKKKACEENLAVSWQMRRRRRTGTVQSEQIPPRIVLTALFPYVIRFSMEISFVDGLCWMPCTDWQHHISHHLSLLSQSVQCTLLAGEVVPGSIFSLWLMFDLLPSLSSSQIVLPRNVDWNQATVSSSSMDWTWGLDNIIIIIIISISSCSIFALATVQVLELR